jgi:2,4-dienoyl-CoA reductase-like NADH-dependent reductase (Old Yellow Enzyme family)
MLLPQIERFLRKTGMPATQFGRLAVQDPRFVADLRNGREPRIRTEMRIERFMTNYLANQGEPHAR